MKTLIFLAACVFASATWANTATSVVKVYSLDVKERVQNLELIDVTAEKTESDQAEAPDLELQSILDEVEALEAED